MIASPLSRRLLSIAIFFGSSMLLHLLWENMQAPLFVGFESLSQHFWICLKATATGDMLFMLIIYATLALIHRDALWIAQRSSYTHPATWVLPILIGILLAVNMELWAVHVDHRWVYENTMPLIPVLQIGLTPILQMIVVPILTILISSRFLLRI